jgi:hypothetical protein
MALPGSSDAALTRWPPITISADKETALAELFGLQENLSLEYQLSVHRDGSKTAGILVWHGPCSIAICRMVYGLPDAGYREQSRSSRLRYRACCDNLVLGCGADLTVVVFCWLKSRLG